MNSPYQDNVHAIFPRFVFHRQYNDMEEFNKRLFELASVDAARNVANAEDQRTIGSNTTHLAHLRHNFLLDCKDETVRQLIEMVDNTVRQYLWTVYSYEHTGELNMLSDTFHQKRAEGQNVGINCHTHFPAHLVVTYYARVDRDPEETNPLRQGAVRFYDPQHVNTRPWPNNNPSVFTNSWFNLVPNEGSMVVFEGHIPHDSTYFDGEHRMCVPVMVDVITPRVQIKTPASKLFEAQDAKD